MCGRKSPHVVALTDQERNELNRWTPSISVPSGLVRRAHVILLVSEDKSLAETAQILGVDRRIVRLWVSRFTEKRIVDVF